MADQRARFFPIQRFQMMVDPDPLDELAEPWLPQGLAQLGLADQDELQQRLGLAVEVREHPQLLERFRVQVLRLVDDEHGALPVGVGR